MNTKCIPTPMDWNIHYAVDPLYQSSLSWSPSQRGQWICSEHSCTTEMEFMPLPLWLETREVNTDHILRQQTNSNIRRTSSGMWLMKQFGLEMIENEKLFLQFQIEFTSSSFKTCTNHLWQIIVSIWLTVDIDFRLSRKSAEGKGKSSRASET
jgi:hypothetical protein